MTRRISIKRQAFVELCLGAKVLGDSPLAQHFLGAPQALWDGWDNIVAALRSKVRRCRWFFTTVISDKYYQ